MSPGAPGRPTEGGSPSPKGGTGPCLEGSGLPWPVACDAEICCFASAAPVGVIMAGGPAITPPRRDRGPPSVCPSGRDRLPGGGGPGARGCLPHAGQGRLRVTLLPSRCKVSPFVLAHGHARRSPRGEWTSEGGPVPPTPTQGHGGGRPSRCHPRWPPANPRA